MLKKVNLDMMKVFIESANSMYDSQYVENYSKELVQELDERLDEIIYKYCKTGKRKDFSFTQQGETFSVLEISAMRKCSYFEAVLLMDEFIKDAETGRFRIMRR